MLVQQALATMSNLVVPVIAPAIIADLGIGAGYVGAFSALTYGAAMVSSLVGGGFMLRYGALRVSQACIVVTGIGLAVAGGGSLALFAVAAILLGLGSGPSTPASSHILARFAPPRLAPFIFSVKQTGVPLGGVLAGALATALVAVFGWQGTLVVLSLAYFGFVLVVQPIRARIDDDRDPHRPVTVGDVGRPLRAVLWEARIRELAIASCVYTGAQIVFGAFLVVYLAKGLGYSLAAAGTIYAVAQGSGIIGRVVLGWVASRFVAPRTLLGILGVAMAAALVAIALLGGRDTGVVVAACLAFGLTGVSFQGVLLAEVARCAPPGLAGLVTGGVVFFAYGSMVVYPAAAGAWIGATGAFPAIFLAAALPAFVVGVRFLVRRSV